MLMLVKPVVVAAEAAVNRLSIQATSCVFINGRESATHPKNVYNNTPCKRFWWGDKCKIHKVYFFMEALVKSFKVTRISFQFILGIDL